MFSEEWDNDIFKLPTLRWNFKQLKKKGNNNRLSNQKFFVVMPLTKRLRVH